MKKRTMCLDYYNLLMGSNDYCFPWKSIWKQKIPSRVAFFVWTAALGKFLTIDNLRKMKVWILDWCYMCKCNGESIDHLFLHCPVGYGVWFVWSELGYATICSGASSMLVRQIWLSSKWVYIVDGSPLLIVVPLEGEK